MTTEEILNYYADLLIIQYRNKPKAYDTIRELVRMVLMDQVMLDTQNAFNLETAVGVQLDVLGDYAGVSRYGYSFSGPITLSDDDFRQLIKFAIIRNNGGSSLGEIQSLLNIFFPMSFLVFDYQNMQMSYFFSSAIGSVQLAEMVVLQELLPKPMAVGVSSVIYAPDIDNFFGFGSYSVPAYNVHGFNTYSVYDTDCPFMSYDYAIIVP